jgi:hypothetical protein
MTDDALSLDAFLEAIAAGLPDVEALVTDDTTVYGTNGTDFAVVRDDEATFRLRSDVARAALGTPDTAPGAEGRDWVRFRPEMLTSNELDRAEAWFVIAHRFASQPVPARRRPD